MSSNTPGAPKIRAVLFDADGVVQRTKPEWHEQLQQLCGNPGDVEAFMRDVFAAEKPCLVGDADFAQELSAVLNRWQSPATTKEALSVWSLIEPDASVFELIHQIRLTGTCVALATNQQQVRADILLHELGYADKFDHIICSCFIGHAKPSAEYFKKAEEIVGLPADEMLFIDDHAKNVAAASVSGLHAEQFHLDDGLAQLVQILQSYRLIEP